MNKISKVLLLEDNASTRLIVSKALQIKGIEVILTSTLEEARQCFGDNSIKLFLLDVHLPDGMSDELIPQIRRLYPMAPILMITAEYDSSHMARLFDAGVKDFIQKPILPLLLSNKVQSFLDWSEVELALFRANENYLSIMQEKEQEEALAFFVYDHILHTHSCSIEGVDVATLSSGRFCGDILISAKSPNGNLIIMLGDATGHGMAAAITVYPMVVTFNAMVKKGLSLGAILRELSDKHSETVPSNRFFACILIEISLSKNTISIWNGGMPNVLIFDHHKQLIDQITAKNMAIGILPTNDISTKFETFPLNSIEYLSFFSDGLIENKRHKEQTLSFDDVYSIIAEFPSDPEYTITRMHAMEADLNSSHDDMTLCSLNLGILRQELSDSPVAKHSPKGNFSFSFELFGDSLLNDHFTLKLVELIESYGFSQSFCQRFFTVMTELIVNSVDHGILNIQSNLKKADFISYLDNRNAAISTLSDNQKITVSLSWESSKKSLFLCVSDSGNGYQIDKEINTSNDQTYGRGLGILNTLCNDFIYDQNTNTTHATLRY
ncbi:MAG: SpoIIE family protein phosphatase [Gammaproteobacteria bacterium]|uniref:Histidine kinase-like ATPase domain-containing protein n=1 Tax=Marinomonas polaris DSM 16579 TaxID=1122206 RepID=A0A1M5I9E6_9GAMM|nr:SpoIIE family protein phosphatase [Marinomonas polaris]MBU1294946.1 SpoIIE family protein phosphatase [Gammaproteobacteria bacterium]MBU1469032.1 SpoIIE family protein phosphatase [Gammaproteobacteria bacterium]MBU2022931.1 SpoIIE family protein phosphatase [Gammaproteobacteria bacterium]MBU2238174.1 SpoIIE family protein phosphatase [Gammaproteobacteria bacterium]MBU2320666.1 SpoIIE family protein phosphatase [Gammaproteobacteria bacterium]|tara:strand:+ start:25449 stop:27104 length:1656 start_codon:yes stop_codon:yes gene_type:complete